MSTNNVNFDEKYFINNIRKSFGPSPQVGIQNSLRVRNF